MSNHKDREHALLSASGANRWLAWAPSALLEAEVPELTNKWAEEGTARHEIAEMCIRDSSLTDKELNQEQIILRNDAGVFVVTPSLNQVFKFEGDWPMNSPKPYLLQSIADIVKQENATIKKQKDGTLVSAKVSYTNNKNFDHEAIMFDKNDKLKWLQIYNKDNTSELKIVFTKCEYDAKIKKAYFKAPAVIEKKASASVISEQDLPLYPVQVFSSELKSAN